MEGSANLNNKCDSYFKMNLLPYEVEVLNYLLEQNALLIFARGLGSHRILRPLLSVYCDPNILVFILGLNNEERRLLIEDLALTINLKKLPTVITNETLSVERERLYLEAGVIFITSQILVVDILQNRVPVEKISGFIVAHAERINEKSREGFILRLFREKNNVGFVKAVSEYPEAFSKGFSAAQRIMKCLYINKLHIRPRFYVSIKDFLKTSEPEVVELKIRFTESMLNIQECIMELLDLCVRELKRINPSLTLDSSYSEEVALSSLHHSLLHQLRGIWHQTSSKTKSLIRDVNELSDLLNYLSEYDCVTFCHYLDSLRASANAENFTDAEKNLWLMLDPTNTLFQQAKKRVYTKIDQNKTLASDNIYFHLEENPKWKLLKEVLLEIQSDMDACPSFRGNVLIFAKNENTCTQIRNFLLVGGKKMLMTLYKQYIQCKPALSNLNSSPSESQGPAKKQVHGFHLKKVDLLATGGMHVVSVSYFQRLQRRRALLARDTAPGAWENVVSGQKKAEDFPNEDVFRLLPSLHITFRSIESLGGPHAMERLLFELKPTFIIFYNANLSLTRQTEVYKAVHSELPLRVYFLFYEPSIEERRYLNSIKREKDSMSTLIREKAIMVLPDDPPGSVDDSQEEFTGYSLGRRAGRHKIEKVQKIIVDVREFRSQLPQLLSAKGIKLEPATLEVGDYILSPEICVERKTVVDLIQSLNSGRLYSQCVSMTNSYKMPVLLIEFDEEKFFSLQSKNDFSGNINFNHVVSKLALLTIHFPRLRLLWCSNPHNAAEVFQKFKVNFNQPNKEEAVTKGIMGPQVDECLYSWKAQNLLRCMAGITAQNIHHVMNKVKNIRDLVNLSLEDMKKLIGPAGVYLYDFCNKAN